MTADSLAKLLADLPTDLGVFAIHRASNGRDRTFEIMEVTETGAIIIKSRSQLLEESAPNCATCGRKLRNPNTRKEEGGGWYCWYRDGWDNCWDRKVKKSGI